MPPDEGAATALLADIGGTHARFALARGDEFGAIVSLQTADFERAEAAVRAFLDAVRLPSPPPTAVLACAGPVENNQVRLTNCDWRIDADAIRSELGFDEVFLVNDFASLAWAIPLLTRADLQAVGGGAAVNRAPSVVLGPGTGLGVAGYLPHHGRDAVIVGEGGHVSLTAVTDRESEVLAVARKELGHVSAERFLSGDGLVRLYEILARLDGIEAPARTASEITDAAAGQGCSLCRAAFDMFCEMLGTVAGNLALTFGARGGVYIAGGIVPKTRDGFAASRFRERFEAKGRFRDYLARIPTSIVIHPEPAFLGLLRVLGATRR
jgi:glucokinase